MRKITSLYYKILLLFICIVLPLLNYSQVFLINPNGDGGFETGTTFAANGWSVTSSATATNNQWVCNTGASGYTGLRCAYISNNINSTPPPNAYTVSATRVSHIFRNITIPSTATSINNLTFNWKANGESCCDYLRVWIVPTTFNPAYGTQITATGSAPTGRVQLGGNFNLQTNWQSASLTVPAQYIGTTFRIVFEWRNDASVGSQPPAAIDNISFSYNTTPTACLNSSAFGSAVAPTNTTPVTISTCNYQTEYSTITNIVAGSTYQVGNSCGGYVTVRRDAFNGTVVGQGNAPFTFTAPTSGTYYIHWNTNSSCGTASNCCSTTITCTSCSTTPTACIQPTPWITVAAPTDPNPLTISTCTFAGEYNTITNVVAGQTYQFTSSITTDWLVLTDGANVVLTSGTTPITWTATFSGTVRLHVSVSNACGTESACRTTTVTCTSCITIHNPCASIPVISGCGVSATANFNGNGAWSPISNTCGFSTPGQERIFSFTPAVSGTYQLNITAISGGWVDVFYKAASSGCNNSGWTCFDDILSTGTYAGINPMCFTAGTTYYIMLDPEHTSAGNMSFNLVCPTAPTISSTNLTICDGGVVNFTGSLNTVLINGGQYYGYYWVLSPDNGTTWYYQNIPNNNPGNLNVPSYNTAQGNNLNLTFPIGSSGNYLIQRWHYDNCATLQISNTLNVTVNPIPAAPTTTNDNICYGATGFPSANTSVNWYTLPTGGTFLGTAQTYTTPSLTATTTYYVEANVNGCISSRVPVTVNVNPFPNSVAPTTTTATGCNIVDPNNWVYLVDPSNTIVAAVNDPTGNNPMGQTAASVTIMPTVQTFNGKPYIQRVVSINPTNSVVPAVVRLYFTDSEFQNLQQAVGPFLTSYTQLGVTKFDGPGLTGNSVYIQPSQWLNPGQTGMPNVYALVFNVGSFSTFAIHPNNNNTPLPIKLINFDVENQKNYVDINWSTAVEINNDFFTVERSSEGENFEEVMKVKGAGNSNEIIYYSEVDYKPLKGQSYYRLKQTDFDGTSTYSEIKAVYIENKMQDNGAIVYPNPLRGENFQVKIITQEEEEVSIEIFDNSGKKLKSTSFTSKIGVNESHQNTNRLGPGIYTVKITGEISGVSFHKLIISN